ncbi:hypothetical protein QYE76_036775 [Lolium multiflorum]|uniref:Arabidopsis retrotransposon Orf1 C-terminal domain-containing protein n=1 Tax=Lolium multiflorum TaxID=4521 RepID=A0AAD8R2L3_LOLMU|nr:hypothetical protein QYE76_036775 [Lolium multiflorum]
MGKPRDTKIAILPSTTRKGTTLSTSALDSPSVISKLVSPPQASNAGTSAESENSSYNCDDASAVLDNDGSLGSFLDATIAKSRQIENTETPNENAATPVNSPESVEYSSDDLDEDYVELDDDFIEKCNATTDARKIKKLLAEHAYMKDIVTNKRKIPNEEISTMLANYSFNGKIPKKLGDPDKLIPTDISLQMADKSTAIPVGLCENVPVQVTQHCLILTDFVVLEMPEDDNMSIIFGRPFLNTAGAVIDCNKGMVTFNIDDKEHTVYFPKRIDKDFEFHRSQTNPMVRYKIYNKTINLPFSDFCTAIRVPRWGSCEKIRGTPRELSNLYTMICNGRSFSNDGGKISSIQQPAIRYFAYFVTKNPSKEIFSELDEINAQGPIFARSFQKREEGRKWGREAPPRQGRAARAGPAPPWCVGPSCHPLHCPFAYLKPPSRNPRPRATIRKTFPDAAAANPISGIQEIASGTLPERGFISQRTLHRHDRLRSDE